MAIIFVLIGAFGGMISAAIALLVFDVSVVAAINLHVIVTLCISSALIVIKTLRCKC